MIRRVGERHLVGSKRTLNLQPVDYLRPGPALGRIEDNHRPTRTHQLIVHARVLLNFLDLLHHRVERCGHGLMHRFGFVTLDKVRRPAAAEQKLLQLVMLDACEYGRVGNL